MPESSSNQPWIRCAPGAEELAEFADPRAFLGLCGKPLRSRPGEEVERRTVRRIGRVHVHLFRGGLFFGETSRELWRARFSHPRSASLGERAWNVFCHLAAHGVGTADLLAVGAAGKGLMASTSFLVVHPPKLGETLAVWRAGGLSDSEREAGERALGYALRRVARAGVRLPQASAETVWLTPNAGDHDCGPDGEGGVPLPGVVFTDVADARVGQPREPVELDLELAARLGLDPGRCAALAQAN